MCVISFSKTLIFIYYSNRMVGSVHSASNNDIIYNILKYIIIYIIFNIKKHKYIKLNVHKN